MANYEASHLDNDDAGGRPYRSHLRPACLECRKRKSRCKTSKDSDVCILCQVRETTCVFPTSNKEKHSERKRTRATRARSLNGATSLSEEHGLEQEQGMILRSSPSLVAIESIQEVLHQPGKAHPSQDASQQSLEDPMGIIASTQDETPHVVGPAVADDSGELENYLYPGSGGTGKRLVRPAPNSHTSHRIAWPVSFKGVYRRPIAVTMGQSAAAYKRDIIEKLIEPYAEDLINLFFTKVNCCFPVFHGQSFLKIYRNMKDKISPAVLSNLYAITLIYWKGSPKLSPSRCPDIRFVWAQANEALNTEAFMSPGIPTILAMVLNVSGRPTTSMFYNGGLVGNAVALANALGLNRDSSDWDIPEAERLFRTNIWWLIVISDRWSSLAYGTPLQVNHKQFDVSVPSIQQLCEINGSTLVAASIFVSIIALTEVLGRILEHIYTVVNSPSNIAREPEPDFEKLLNDWEEKQIDEIRRIIFRGTDLDAPGAANLRLAYLAVKFLLRRVQVGLSKSMARSKEETSIRSFTRAQRAAEEIVHFVQELKESEIRGFWFPMHAFTLTSATTFLLRCALSHQGQIQETSKKLVNNMIKALRNCQQKYSWDLADNCLDSYGNIMERLDSVTDGRDSTTIDLDRIFDMDMSSLQDVFPQFDDFLQSDLDEFLQDNNLFY